MSLENAMQRSFPDAANSATVSPRRIQDGLEHEVARLTAKLARNAARGASRPADGRTNRGFSMT